MTLSPGLLFEVEAVLVWDMKLCMRMRAVVMAMLVMMMCTVIVTMMMSSEHMVAAYDKDEVTAKALTYLKEHRDVQEKDMRDYIAIPSVAAESKMDAESRRAAEWLAEWLQTRLGMKDAKLYESGYRHPSVIASSGDSSKPGVVVYGHYDVQPADGEWTISGPFEAKKLTLEGYGEVLTGRGASDCKGQQYLALSALEALDKSLPGGLASLPINIIVCVEGEDRAVQRRGVVAHGGSPSPPPARASYRAVRAFPNLDFPSFRTP